MVRGRSGEFDLLNTLLKIFAPFAVNGFKRCYF
jgi:hypothetical protein